MGVTFTCNRLVEMGEHAAAAQLYISMELMKEAIDTFIAAEDWSKARKVAKELEPAYESYVESKYKDRLLKKGDVEQLADVGMFYFYTTSETLDNHSTNQTSSEP